MAERTNLAALETSLRIVFEYAEKHGKTLPNDVVAQLASMIYPHAAAGDEASVDVYRRALNTIAEAGQVP